MRRPDRDSLSTLALAGGTTFFAKSIHVAETAALPESPSLLNMLAVDIRNDTGICYLYLRNSVRETKVALRNAVNKVPIGRYIVFVGSLLLAMLFVADWLVPMGATQSVTGGKADKPIISIKSDHKWPERIVFDTSAPTIVAQMPPIVAVTPVT